MKKHLLLTTGLFVIGLLNAQVTKNVYTNKIPAHLVNKSAISIDKNKGADLDPGFAQQAAINNPLKIVANKNAQTSTLTSTVIGRSFYESQTNGGVGNRIVLNNDGTIASVWTMEALSPNLTYPNRGTGYNYFDGSNWGAIPTVRIESARTGWPAIAHTGTGKEVVLSHGISGGKINVLTRAVKGTGVWASSITAIPTATNGGNFWPRMVATKTGDTLYALTLTYPTASGGAMYQGLDGAVVFHRSLDGGITWDMNNVVPAGLDASTNKFSGFGGDSYAIACKGNIIAIVAGDVDRDVVMVKSMDAGTSWAATTVWDCPIDKWDHTTTTSDYDNDGDADTLTTNDGSFTIAIDNYNEACVAFGAMRIFQDNLSTVQSWSHMPFTDGIYFWKESMGASTFPVQKPTIVAGIEDLAPLGSIYFPPQSDPNTSPFGVYGCSLSSFSSLAIDQNNTIYLSYSSVVDSLISIADPEKLLRHQYIIKSCDNGNNWGSPIDVTANQDSIPQEGVYGSLASSIDGNLHLVYLRDHYAGNEQPDDLDEYDDLNDIIYVKIPTSDLSCEVTIGVGELDELQNTQLSIYPNPATTNAAIEVTLNESNKMEIVMFNNIGQTIYSTKINGNVGLNKVSLNLNDLSSGIYFCQVKVGNGQAITKKLIVSK